MGLRVSFNIDKDVLGVDAGEFCRMLAAEGIPAGALSQQYVLKWEVFRRLHADPNAFGSYRPQRLKKGSYALASMPNARDASTHIGSIPMSQHNTVGEARAAAKGIRKIVAALRGFRQ